MNFPMVGCRLNEITCSFTVWAPLKEKVELVIDGGRTYSMNRDEMGCWNVELERIPPGTRYYFRLDGKEKLPDPASRSQPDGVHGASAVTEPDYPWEDDNWKGLQMSEMVLYELHVGTFTRSHNFKGIESRLAYLSELGINAIELMPVAQFPGDRNWGYDGVFPYAVQNSYGGYRGLKSLVNAAHLAGIAVILDVVYNHQGPEGNYLGEYGPYFTDKYKTGWGQAINFDDAYCDGVRNFYWQNALMWLDEFHLDGLRLDAVHAIRDFSANHFIEGLAERVRSLEEQNGRKKVLIAELDLNDPRYISPVSAGGYGLDGQWTDEYHHALHSLITGEVEGYYEDFGKTVHLARALNQSYVYTGQYSPHRKKLFGRKPQGTTYDQFVVFAQNHDQVGNRMLGDRLSTLVSREALKLAACACILSPHVPMLFMGEEYGEKNPFQYFVSHTDEKLVESVRKGRKEEFSYFKWQGEVPDPQSGDTFQNCVLSWDLAGTPQGREMFHFYQHLIGLRKEFPALAAKSRDSLFLLPSMDGIIVFERRYKEDRLLVTLNFRKDHSSWMLPSGEKLRRIMNSASARWSGPASDDETTNIVSGKVELHPESVSVFEFL